MPSGSGTGAREPLEHSSSYNRDRDLGSPIANKSILQFFNFFSMDDHVDPQTLDVFARHSRPQRRLRVAMQLPTVSDRESSRNASVNNRSGLEESPLRCGMDVC